MTLYDQAEYMEDVRRIAQIHLPWEKLAGCNIVLSGAAGMIGSFLTDVLMEKKRTELYGLRFGEESGQGLSEIFQTLDRRSPCAGSL